MSNILENLLKAFETNTKDPFLQYGIAIEYRNIGDEENALKFFQTVHKNFPDYIPNYYHFGQMLEQFDKFNEAKEIYSQGINVAKDADNLHAVSELQAALDIIE